MKYLSYLFLFALSTQAKAVDFLLEFGIHGGGDEIANVTFVSGNTKSIDGGGLLAFSVGLVFDHGDYTSRFKYGLKTDSIDAVNGSLDWDRYVGEAMLMYKIDSDLQVGAGISYHTGVELSGTGVVAGSAKFDDAVGLVIEADYFWDDKSYLGLSFTSIDYEINGVNFNGSSVGLLIGGIF